MNFIGRPFLATVRQGSIALRGRADTSRDASVTRPTGASNGRHCRHAAVWQACWKTSDGNIVVLFWLIFWSFEKTCCENFFFYIKYDESRFICASRVRQINAVKYSHTSSHATHAAKASGKLRPWSNFPPIYDICPKSINLLPPTTGLASGLGWKLDTSFLALGWVGLYCILLIALVFSCV